MSLINNPHPQPTLCEFFVVRIPGRSYLTIPSAWVSNNVEGTYKRSVSLAMAIGLCVNSPV